MNPFKMTFKRKKFLTLLVTASASLAVSMLLVISDSVIAGRMIGESAVAAVELVAPLYGVVIFLGSLISGAASSPRFRD